jgi:hypothetical protein
MDALGWGYGDSSSQIDEDKNGIIVLDECSKFFNARQWGDKGRQPLLDWLIHSGKLRWHVYYQMQGLEQVDKQLRSTQIEFHVSVKRTDRWPIPGVTWLAGLVGFDLRFPKMHIGIIKQGCDRDSMIVDQKFLDRDHPDACGIHTVLSRWHVEGRYLPPKPSKLYCFFAGLLGIDYIAKLRQQRNESPRLKPKHALAVALSKLPEQERIRHFKRLDSIGAFN